MTRALIVSAADFEDFEFGYPYYRLQEAGVDVDVATPEGDAVTGKHGYEFDADLTVADADVDAYDAVIIPGANSPEALRMDCREAIDLVAEFDAAGKTVAAICHGTQVLISAGIIDGRDATCWWGVMDDLRAAGASVQDEPVVVDDNLITSRCPDDLPNFMEAVLNQVG